MNFDVMWSVDDFLENGKNKFQQWVSVAILFIGIAMMFFGVFQLFKAVTAQQGSGGHWVKAIIGIFLGGAITFGGWALIEKIAKGGQETINDLGTGSALIDHSTIKHIHDYQLDPYKVDLKDK